MTRTIIVFGDIVYDTRCYHFARLEQVRCNYNRYKQSKTS